MAEAAGSRWGQFETEGRRRPLPKGGLFTFLLVLLLLAPFDLAWMAKLLEFARLYPRTAWICAAVIGSVAGLWVWKKWSDYTGEGID